MKLLLLLLLTGCGAAKFESVVKSKRTTPVVTPTPTVTPMPCEPIDDPGQSDDPTQNGGN